MAKRRRKTRTHLKGPNHAAGSSSNAPKSFVIRSGKVGRSTAGLVSDVRKTMEPNTASRLKERKSNKLRDFVAMAGPLGVSHLVVFNQTDAGVNMRIARCPRGPTCTFRVNKFALCNDILHSQRRPRAPGGEYNTHPLLVLNNFGGEARHLKLLVSVFQNLFPPIQVQTMHLSQARRVVLLSYNAQTETIEWRHYLISVRPVGVSRSVRRVVEGTTKPGGSSSTATTAAPAKRKGGKGIPNLGNVGDISEYVLGRNTSRSGSVGATSDTDLSEAESEVEDMNDPNNAVELFQRYVGRGNDANEQRAVRLREIGPRMELKLIKIEEGMGSGETLYHDRVKKTAKQAAELKQGVAAKKKLREERRAEQEKNVERKKAEAEARKTGGVVAEATAENEQADDDEYEDVEVDDFGLDDDADAGEEEDDEFEYEDRFGKPAAVNKDEAKAELFDEDSGDEDGDASEPEDSDEEKSFDDGNDESDLEPIPLNGGLQAYSDSDEPMEEGDEEEDGSDEEDDDDDAPPPAQAKRTKVAASSASSSKGKGKANAGRSKGKAGAPRRR